ncbi:hypothetical protein ASG80_20565 [Agromyces sp. Soil535]|nr:hypothetical protein ASG80_20565 [Agromyces sp. Soil535]
MGRRGAGRAGLSVHAADSVDERDGARGGTVTSEAQREHSDSHAHRQAVEPTEVRGLRLELEGMRDIA